MCNVCFCVLFFSQENVFVFFRWMDGSPMDYVAWASYEPNFANNDENCVLIYRNLGTVYLDSSDGNCDGIV